jgi:Cof subfamily protein (haloacid dehalogenase superfamily)
MLVLTALSTALALVATRAPRVVFTDCDGTMLQSDHTLSPAASAMLHTLDERGIVVVPATGRARAGPWTEAVLDVHPVLQRGYPGVYINGCSAFDEHGSQIVSTFLPEPCVRRMLEWHASGGSSGNGLVAYVSGEAQYVDGVRTYDCALIERLAALGDSPPRAVESIEAERTYKMIVLCPEEEEAERLRGVLGPLVRDVGGELTQALPGYLEIVPRIASKAVAASVLLERWGMGWDEAVAIGDGSNDVPMLLEAGTSVAMGNAGDGVKGVAQHVVGSNDDDGWVDAMERFVLDRL